MGFKPDFSYHLALKTGQIRFFKYRIPSLQERKEAERKRVIEERCGVKKDFEASSNDDLKKICSELFERVGIQGGPTELNPGNGSILYDV